MGGSKVETNGFKELLLDRIVTHKAEAMIEFRFQFGEGFSPGFAGFSLDKYGGQLKALKSGESRFIQLGSHGKHHQPGRVGDGFS
jgi:hypothetical protein